MTPEERNIELKHLITCMKCEVSGKVCDENCPTQYEAGNMGEIIENLEAISEILEQKEKRGHWITLKDEYDDIVEAVCSCCDNNGNYKWVYCPNCGARMVSE